MNLSLRKVHASIVLSLFMRLMWVVLISTILQSISSNNLVYAASVPTNGLLAEYLFNGNGNDTSGNGNNLVLYSSQFIMDGDRYVVNLADGGYADIQNSSSLDFSNILTNYTLGFWFKTNEIHAGLYSVEASQYGPPSTSGNDRHMYLLNGNICQRLWFDETICSTGVNYADNNWHFAVQKLDSSSGQYLYVDGTLVASGYKGNSDFNWTNKAMIGFSYDIMYSYGYTDSLFDDFRFYNRILSDSEIVDLYNEGGDIIIVPPPTNLTQQIQSPGLSREPVRPGEKVGKYQSGSGVILSASGNVTQSSRLVVEVYRLGSDTPSEFHDEYSMSPSKEVTIAYLGAGDYRWRARVETASGVVSDWVDFGTANPEEVDYILYEGFEPYPHGYRFPNSTPSDDILDGGINETFWTKDRYKADGNKWTIFNKIFPEYTYGNRNKMFDAFESLGMKSGFVFQAGSCFGMAVSAGMQYSHPTHLQQYFPEFSAKIGTGTIWSEIGELGINSNKNWNVYDNTVETILAFQLAQYDEHINKERHILTGAIDAYTTLKNNPDISYVLIFRGTHKNGDKLERYGHVVTPYKVESLSESKRIYIWDSNYPVNSNYTNTLNYGYNQYIEIYSGGTWKAVSYTGGWTFDEMVLVNIDSIQYRLNQVFNGSVQSSPIGFNGSEILATLNGTSDIIFTDSIGRMSGFSGGTILEEIPGVQVIVPLNITLSGAPDNTWKQIYLPEKQDGLTIRVSGKAEEQYTLMVAGGDYYTKVEGVTTSTGEIDSYQISRESVGIDFDDAKTGTYALLVDNFQDTLTGTVYMDNIKTSTGTEQYTINWEGVVSGVLNAVQYTVDYDTDGIDDLTLGLPAVYRDITAPTTTHTLSGELLAGTTSTYIESVVLTLSSLDDVLGVGVDTIYYALGTDTGSLVYLPYTEPIVVNGVGTYTLHYYAVDNFGNQEEDRTIVFTLIERPETHAGNISGYVYDDTNQNGVRDPGEKGMAGWKVCIDTNNNTTCEENTEVFHLSNNDGYYEFDSLITGVYSVLEIPHQNWIITAPIPPTVTYSGRYLINLLNGQRLQNQNFGNYKVKGGKK